MKVLDIDLDFFLSEPCPFADVGCRPSDDCAVPWSEVQVRQFLEQNLGLDRCHPLRGRVFDTHEGALLFWQDMWEKGVLTSPFEITHVDTHTDLGIAQKNYPFVRMNMLGRPVDKRRDFEQYIELGQLNEANYLAFAVGARMVSRLENLRNPNSKPDLPVEMLDENGNIQLHSAFPSLFEAKYGSEPAVVYRQYDDPFAYSASESFALMSLAISPRYTPRNADYIKDIVCEYMSL